jgi:hypothetical protein
MPIQKIDPDKSVPVRLSTEHLADDGLWYGIGGTRGGQIEGCFDWLNDADGEEKVRVAIKYTDYEGKEYTTPCVILRDGTKFGPKRIWCELL